MKLRDYDDAALAKLKYALIEFQGGMLDEAFKDHIQNSVTLYMNELKSKSTPLEDVRYAQGGLAQAIRDIMICEGLLKAVEREIADRLKRTQ